MSEKELLVELKAGELRLTVKENERMDGVTGYEKEYELMRVHMRQGEETIAGKLAGMVTVMFDWLPTRVPENPSATLYPKNPTLVVTLHERRDGRMLVMDPRFENTEL